MRIEALKGDDLDYWVARALGATFKHSSIGALHAFVDGAFIGGFVTKTSIGVSIPDRMFQPTKSWSQAGPIIERNRITVWDAKTLGHDHNFGAHMTPTPRRREFEDRKSVV